MWVTVEVRWRHTQLELMHFLFSCVPLIWFNLIELYFILNLIYFCWSEMTPHATRAPAFPVALLPSSSAPVPLKIWNSLWLSFHVRCKNSQLTHRPRSSVAACITMARSAMSLICWIQSTWNKESRLILFCLYGRYRDHWHCFEGRYKTNVFVTLRLHPQE